MLKNSWLCICLLIISSSSFAGENASLIEDEDALYENNRSTLFNEQEDRLNDQGYIDDMEASEVQDIPNKYSVPLKSKATDCKETGAHSEDCEDITIVN